MQLTKFQELWSVVSNFEIDRIAQTELKIFLEVGLETNLNDIFEVDDGLVTVLKDGTVRKTIVYISEVKKWVIEQYGKYPKFHIYNCQTLNQMRKAGREHRYKKTLRKDGKFLMIISDKNGKSQNDTIRLEVCGYCLSKYNSTKSKRFLKSNFRVDNFLKEPIVDNSFNNLDYLHFKDDLESVPSFYAKNWAKISSELKKMRNFTCEACGVQLETSKKYLHTHHVDSNLKNNIISNLKVLCIECHSNEFNHSHIKQNHLYKEFLLFKNILNKDNNTELKENCPKCSSTLTYLLGAAKEKSKIRCKKCGHIFSHNVMKVWNEG